MAEIGYLKVDDLVLREPPARDPCFKVVWRDADMSEQADLGEVARREVVHRHMTNEITSLDIAADTLVEFPEAPWDLRMELARQCWDESRHVEALHRRLKEMGGRKGEFPISVLEWSVTCALDNIAGRLATQNRTLEAGAMDVVGGLKRAVEQAGDTRTADLLDAILADEVQHVRFANRWIRRLAQQDRRVLLKVASAVRFLSAANEKFQIREGEVNLGGVALGSAEERIPAVNIEDRRLAEFTDDEIHEILRQAGFRSLIPRETPS
jgi:uncharacterized ferritin-like protein (DUF455 family)